MEVILRIIFMEVILRMITSFTDIFLSAYFYELNYIFLNTLVFCLIRSKFTYCPFG